MENKKPSVMQIISDSSDDESTARTPPVQAFPNLNRTGERHSRINHASTSAGTTNMPGSSGQNVVQGVSLLLPPPPACSDRQRYTQQIFSPSNKLQRSRSTELMRQQINQLQISSKSLLKRFKETEHRRQETTHRGTSDSWVDAFLLHDHPPRPRNVEILEILKVEMMNLNKQDRENRNRSLKRPINLGNAQPPCVGNFDTGCPSTSAANGDRDRNETANNRDAQQNDEAEGVMGPSHSKQPSFNDSLNAQRMEENTEQGPPAKVRRMKQESTRGEEASRNESVTISGVTSETETIDIEGDSPAKSADHTVTSISKNVLPVDAVAQATKQPKNKQGRVASTAESMDLKLNQALLTLFECPVCLEWMEPPMMQCRRGHLICVMCRGRIPRCPVCRSSFTTVRNRAMEQVAEKLRYPCRYACGAVILLRLRARHEASCQRRLYSCPMPACAGAPDSTPMPHDALRQHHQLRHPESVMFNERNNFNVDPHNQEQRDWIVFAHGQIFHVKFCNDNRNWGMYCSVAYIGPKKNARNYMYKVKIAARENSREQTFKRETHNDSDLKRADSFLIPIEHSMQYVRNERIPLLPFTISIQLNPDADTVRDADTAY